MINLEESIGKDWLNIGKIPSNLSQYLTDTYIGIY